MKGDLLVGTLGLIVAFSSVLSEHLLARDKSTGWLWSMASSILAGIFFLCKGHPSLSCAEALNVPFAIYGLHKWKSGVAKVTRTDNRMAIGAVMTILVYFFCSDHGDGWIADTFTSSAWLIGGIFIARNKKSGWCLSLAADVVLMYLLLTGSCTLLDYVFIIFQAASIGIAIRKTLKKSISTENTALASRVLFWLALLLKGHASAGFTLN